MDNKVADGLRDYITAQNFKLESEANLSTMRYRCKMKAGVRTLTTTGLTGVIWGIDRGLGAGVERGSTSGSACGEYVTLFMWPGTATFRNQYSITASTLGIFFSQFEIVYDALPEYCGFFSGSSNAVVINSPDFQAPVGLFDFPDVTGMTFTGSTFKTAPKLFTDRVMSEFQQFPVRDPGSPWAPFAGCPNLTKVAFQGTFGPFLEVLWPCDFTYYVDGFGKFDGYPNGGSPRIVKRFVNATKARFSEPFPIIDSSRLIMAIQPFYIDEMVIDALGAPVMPFGGIDYSKAPPMKKLHIKSPKWTVDLPMQSDEQRNFIFGWGSLGMKAPTSCEDVANLHTLWMNRAIVERPVNIATAEYLKTQLHYSWGAALDSFMQSAAGSFTTDQMPKVPSGIKRSEGHYQKILIGREDDMYGNARFGSLRLPLQLNQVNYSYQIQRLPNTVTTAISYIANLFSDHVISQPVTVPALPSGVSYLRDCYSRAFYNTVGPKVPISPSQAPPTILIAYSRTASSRPRDWGLIADADDTYNGPLKGYFNNAKSRSVQKKNGWDSHNVIRNESWITFSEMIAGLKQPGTAVVNTEVITAPITLERESFTNVQYCGGFQQECFFGAAINPKKVDALIPVPQANEWDCYVRALNIYIGYSIGQPLEYWQGRLRVPADNITETDRDVNFVAMVGYGSFDISDFSSFIYNINDIKWSGPPRTEGTNVIRPYRQATSVQTIIGDRTAWLPAHGINLTDPATFSSGVGQAITDFVSFRGTPMGINAFYFNDSNQTLTDARAGYLFYPSYIPTMAERWGGSDLVPTPEHPLEYQDPLWIDSDSMRRGPLTEFAISTQSDLTAAENAINSYV